jgi:hypothetical protein
LRIAGRKTWRGALKVPKHGPLFGLRQMARHQSIMGHEMGIAVNKIIMDR